MNIPCMNTYIYLCNNVIGGLNIGGLNIGPIVYLKVANLHTLLQAITSSHMVPYNGYFSNSFIYENFKKIKHFVNFFLKFLKYN